MTRIWALGTLLVIHMVGCSPQTEPLGGVTPVPVVGAIHKTFDYLESNQVTKEKARRSGGRMFAGEWEQRLSLGTLESRDSNAFSTAMIICYLSRLSEENAGKLALSEERLAAINTVRSSAVESLQHFRYTRNTPAFDSYGYWPMYHQRPWKWEGVSDFLDQFSFINMKWFGDLEPVAPRVYFRSFRIWPDSDTTSSCYSALLFHSELSGDRKAAKDVRLCVFGRYLDQSNTNRYAPKTSVLQSGSGTFLTWLPPETRPDCPNEVDLVVNANVLVTLGRYKHLHTPGVKASVAWINRVIREGTHQNPRDVTTHYQHAWMIHACVARAYKEGGVEDLKPSVKILLREVLSHGMKQRDNTILWRGESPVLATACAASTLIDADYQGPVLDGAIRYLVKQQGDDGSWKFGVIHMGSDENGLGWKVKSRAAYSAFIMDVLCRYALTQRVTGTRGNAVSQILQNVR